MIQTKYHWGQLVWVVGFSVMGLPYLPAQNVGIGTQTPQFKLDVRTGSINTDSMFRIGGVHVLSVPGDQNTFVGVQSGAANTTGIYNTALGNDALKNNTTGYQNTAFGQDAMLANISGYFNTAVGSNSLASNINGHRNTAIGATALGFNNGGYENTAVGNRSLYFNFDGLKNVAIGNEALYSNGGGDENTAIGAEAMHQMGDANWNTAVGARSLYLNNVANFNTAVGYAALYSCISPYNVAVGSYCLHDNDSGVNNVAAGHQAAYNNEDGNYNTAIGDNAYYHSTNAYYNVALGYKAGYGFVMGYNNTLVGSEANVAFAGQFNSIAIGLSASCPDNSTVRIGNTANWSYGGYAAWTNFSDGRYKRDVRENVVGLDFILRLRPVTYHIDVSGLSRKLHEFRDREPDESMRQAIAEKEQMLWTGFIAQEVEEAATNAGFQFSGVDKPRNEHGVYGLRYAEFVVPLVKAVQELNKEVEILRARIQELELERD